MYIFLPTPASDKIGGSLLVIEGAELEDCNAYHEFGGSGLRFLGKILAAHTSHRTTIIVMSAKPYRVLNDSSLTV